MMKAKTGVLHGWVFYKRVQYCRLTSKRNARDRTQIVISRNQCPLIIGALYFQNKCNRLKSFRTFEDHNLMHCHRYVLAPSKQYNLVKELKIIMILSLDESDQSANHNSCRCIDLASSSQLEHTRIAFLPPALKK